MAGSPLVVKLNSGRSFEPENIHPFYKTSSKGMYVLRSSFLRSGQLFLRWTSVLPFSNHLFCDSSLNLSIATESFRLSHFIIRSLLTTWDDQHCLHPTKLWCVHASRQSSFTRVDASSCQNMSERFLWFASKKTFYCLLTNSQMYNMDHFINSIATFCGNFKFISVCVGLEDTQHHPGDPALNNHGGFVTLPEI